MVMLAWPGAAKDSTQIKSLGRRVSTRTGRALFIWPSF